MPGLKLFVELIRGEWFHFGDKPDRKLMKTGDKTYFAPERNRHSDPHVAVVPDKVEGEPRKSFYDQTKDE